jgi:hypothetical protein
MPDSKEGTGTCFQAQKLDAKGLNQAKNYQGKQTFTILQHFGFDYCRQYSIPRVGLVSTSNGDCMDDPLVTD